MNSEKQSTNLQMTLREVNRVGEVKKNIPKLRFKGYEDAWEQRKLGEFCDMFNGDRSSKYPNASDMLPEGIPFINAGDLQEGRVNLETCNKISKSKYDELSGAKLSEGDIVYCLRGSLGKNAYIDNFSEGTIASSLVAIRPKMINGRFLFHILNSDIEYKQRVLRDEGAAQPNLSAKSLSEFFIPIPEAEEDQSVADFFDNVDNYITLHQRKYDALKSMKKTLLSKMFPKDRENVPEIRFKGFTDAWEQRKLGTAINVKSGKDYKHLDEGDVPVYGTGGYMLSVSEALEDTRDAIGIGRKGTIDKPFVLKAPFWTVDTLFYCIPKENNSLSFLYSLFQSINWKLYDESTGVPSLSKTAIDGVTIKLTSEDEQSSIGECFESVDNLITLHQRKLDELKNMKKTLLQQMFV